jgi:hypothetical protein
MDQVKHRICCAYRSNRIVRRCIYIADELRVPRAEFVAVLGAEERLGDEQAARGVSDWYAAAM